MKSALRRLAVAAAVIAVATPALAQEAFTPPDSCVEIDHSGQNPFGSPSAVRVYLVVPPEHVGSWLDLAGDGASGPISGAGEVGPGGLAVVDMPLYSYGDHFLTGGILDPGGAEIAIDTTGLGFVVDASEPVCNPDDLVLVAPQTTTTVTTTTMPQTTTTVAASTTTTTVAPVDQGPEDDPGRGFPWFPVGLGVIILVGGAIVYRGLKTPCEDELAAWLAAQHACDEARRAAQDARQACDDATARVDALREQLKEVCEEWPPACSDVADDSWIEESGKPETRITSLDLHLKRLANAGLWASYQAGDMTAQELEQAWKEMETPEFTDELRQKDTAARAKVADLEAKIAEAEQTAGDACDRASEAEQHTADACAKAAAAKAAYEACMKAAVPPPPPTGGDGGGTDPGGTDPGGTAPPPEAPPTPPSTPEDEEEEDPVCCPEGVWVGYGWSVGGSILFGWETTVANFICLCDPSKYVDMLSKSVRAGIMVGGETSGFLAIMWGAPHAENVPLIWADKSASGWDGDLSLGPSISKGIKSVVKDVGTGAGWDYLKWAAKNKVPASNLDPRRIKELVPSKTSMGVGAAKDAAMGQAFDPQLMVVPFGAGLQVGVWKKWCQWVRVRSYASCGCYPPDYPL